MKVSCVVTMFILMDHGISVSKTQSLPEDLTPCLSKSHRLLTNVYLDYFGWSEPCKLPDGTVLQTYNKQPADSKNCHGDDCPQLAGRSRNGRLILGLRRKFNDFKTRMKNLFSVLSNKDPLYQYQTPPFRYQYSQNWVPTISGLAPQTLKYPPNLPFSQPPYSPVHYEMKIPQYAPVENSPPALPQNPTKSHAVVHAPPPFDLVASPSYLTANSPPFAVDSLTPVSELTDSKNKLMPVEETDTDCSLGSCTEEEEIGRSAKSFDCVVDSDIVFAMVGLSAVHNRTILIWQDFPKFVQPMYYRKCRTNLNCEQDYLPVNVFSTDVESPADSQPWQEFVMVESGCKLK